MKDEDCVRFLQWALPRLHMRWAGFRKVRGQVCKRISRRMEEIGCSDTEAYRGRLAGDEKEWQVLDGLCRITISRFYRDRPVFDALRTIVLPELARRALERNASSLRCLSAGCASGEEPYTVSILWRVELCEAFPQLPLEIVATDTDPVLLARARRGCYPESALRDLPRRFREEAFTPAGEELCLSERFREPVDFRLEDVRRALPQGVFDLLLCRNLVFTYFEPSLQREIQERLLEKIRPGGALVVGERETPLPVGLEPWIDRSGIYRKVGPDPLSMRSTRDPPR